MGTVQRSSQPSLAAASLTPENLISTGIDNCSTQTPTCCKHTAAPPIQLRLAPPPCQWGPESSAPLEPMCISVQIDPIAASITWSAPALLIPRCAAMSGTM